MSRKNRNRNQNNRNNKPPLPAPVAAPVVLPAITPEKEAKIGRPPDYELKVLPRLNEVEYWGFLGLTNVEMAQKLNIAESTFYEYQNDFSEFSESIRKYKPLSNKKVVQAGFQRACGYDYYEEIEEMVPRRDEFGQIMLDTNENPIMVMAVTKRTKKHVPADSNLNKFWLINRDKLNWQLKDSPEININATQTQTTNTQNNNVNLNHLTKEELHEKIMNLYEIRSNNDIIQN